MVTIRLSERAVERDPMIRNGSLNPPASYRAAPTAGPGFAEKRGTIEAENKMPKMTDQKSPAKDS